MNDSFQNGESIAIGAKKILYEQYSEAVRVLTKSQDLNLGVHEARRNIKKSRAVLRLLQFEIGNRTYRDANRFLRNAAKKLSFLRDLSAMLETLEHLENACRSIEGNRGIASIRDHITAQRSEYLVKKNETISRVSDAILKKRSGIYNLKISDACLPHLLEGLQNTYRIGRSLSLLINKNPTPDRIHHWRKKAKCLRYQFKLLENVWPPIFETTEKELHQLTNYLGDFNNLTVLQTFLSLEDLPVNKKGTQQLHKLIAKQQDGLLPKAQNLGTKLYAETPIAFTNRMDVYLQSWNTK